MKLIGRIGPAHRLQRQNREKSLKWPQNDQFRQFQFLIRQFFGSNYTPFEAELQTGFFETTYRSVGYSVTEILTINEPKNRSTNFAHPMVMDPEKSIFDDDSEFNQIW